MFAGNVGDERAPDVSGTGSAAQHTPLPRQGKADEGALLRAIEALVCQHPRYGYRMIHALLVEDGFKVGRDRVYRLRREHGYGVPNKPVKKRRLGVSENGIMRQKAESINDVWCWDFIHDRDERGRVLRWLVIEDEFTREGLAVEVRRSFKAQDVLDVLCELMMIRGVPGHIRGQRAGVHRPGDPGVPGTDGRGDAVHRARDPVAERVCRELQQPVPRRSAQPGIVRRPGRGPAGQRLVEEPLQPPSAAFVTGLSTPGSIRRIAGHASAPARGCAPRLHYGTPSDRISHHHTDSH